MNSNVSQVIDGAGPITGLFVLLLGVAVFFIWRSLNKQMKKELILLKLSLNILEIKPLKNCVKNIPY